MPEEINVTIPIIKPMFVHDAKEAISSLCWSNDGKLVAIGLSSGMIRVFDFKLSKKVYEYHHHSKDILSIQFSPAGNLLASASEDGFVQIWSLSKHESVASTSFEKNWVEHLLWSDDGLMLLCSGGKIVRKISIADGSTFDFDPHLSTVTGLKWLDEKIFGTTSYCALKLFNAELEKTHKVYEWKGSLIALEFDPLKRYGVCGSQDGSVHIWNLKSGQDLAMSGFKSKVKNMSFHYSGNVMANSDGGDILVWDFTGKGPAGKTPAALSPVPSTISFLKFQNKGDLLCSTCKDGVVLFWKPDTDEAPIAIAGVQDHACLFADWSPDDQFVAVAHAPGVLTVYKAPEADQNKS